MRRLTIEVAGRETASRRFRAAMRGRRQGEYLSFPDLETLHKVLTPRRLRVLARLQRGGPTGVRALARALGMDPGNLARDLKVLKEFGLVTEAEGGVEVPYDEIRLELVIRKAA
ncbi:MAG TPA: ArsR family transcriptional regulator [Chromatiales bacterium]|nr:ArsR family transcriptional regulator [Chromatiales bacterium]